MHRFFAHSKNISSDKIKIIDPFEAHHLRDVLRIKPKEKVSVFDEKGNGYSCSVESLEGEVVLAIKERLKASGGSARPKLTIACAIPKNSKMDDIVDKLTQLGVDKIVPLLSERVIIKMDKEKKASRVKRWEKIALSAAKQSQRFSIPELDDIKDVKQALLDSRGYDLKLILTLGFAQRKTLKEVFKENKSKNVYLLIGPEGDFTEREIEEARGSGFTAVTLGELVLRVETAAVAAASFIRFYIDEES